MGRRPEEPKLTRDPRTKIYFVRFRADDGRRLHRSTGTRDRREAQKAGERICREANAEVGRLAKGRRSLEETAAEWGVQYRASHAASTADSVDEYVSTHWMARWVAMDEINSVSLAAYVADRLSVVTASTVRKEMSAMRSFLAWCLPRGYCEPIEVPSVPKRAVGTPYEGGKRTPRRVELQPATARAILAALPEANRAGHPVRDVAEFAWETTLRIATIEALSRPRHYRPGAAVLTITPDIDKARMGRDVPLSKRARAILDAHAAEDGPIFGRGTLRYQLERAALLAGVPPDDARRVGPHDLRHGATTDLASRSTNIAGIAYLAGHKHITTTARYVHAGQAAAQAALDARNGTQNGTPQAKPKKAAKAKVKKRPKK